MADNLIERILKTIRNYDMVSPGDIVLAAVSGGPDSVFLLHALASLKKKLGIAKVIVCHLDHGLRAKESAADRAFVEDLAAQMKLEYLSKEVDIKKLKTKDLSTEETARAERYKFFKEAAGKFSANVLATGHTLDDQAETILMRIVKGASLKGMAGISPVREEAGVRVIRPLIELEKKEIAVYLDSLHMRYRTDSTNAQDIYFRNVVRSKIIPFLEQYNPRLKRSLSNLAEHLREDLDFISGEKMRILSALPEHAGKIVEIPLKEFVLQPRAIQKEILRDSLEKAGGEVKKLSFRHWKELETLIRRKGKGASVDLPGDIRATRTDRLLKFFKR